MKIFTKITSGVLALTLAVPCLALAETSLEAGANAKIDTHLAHFPQTFRRGTVTEISGNTITLHGKDNTNYTINTTDAKFIRRFGGTMQLADIQVNDILKVRGMIDGTAMSAVQIQDESLQSHNGIFVGTVSAVSASSFTLLSKSRGTQTINFSTSTIFRLGSPTTTQAALAAGQTVTVIGVWDRTNSNVTAKKVEIKISKITVKGTVVGNSSTQLTVSGKDGKNYIVDIAKAKLFGKHRTKITALQINLNDQIEIRGTLIEGSVNVAAAEVKDSTVLFK